jgi:membrane fusion protein (multidrug efflux system)
MKYFTIGFFLSIILFGCSQDKKDLQKNELITSMMSYPAIKVEIGGLSTQLKLPAQLVAFEEVNIFPKVNAYVKTVEVEIGDRVLKGRILLRLEAPELEQAVLASKEKYLRTRTELQIDNEHYLRLLEASRTEGAISPYDLSTIKSKVLSDSILSNAEKANWDMQKSMMEYLNVRAPFDGVITERNVHPGALVNATVKDKPMLQLKQTVHLRLQVDVPEALAAQMLDGDSVSFFTSAFPGKKIIGTISRKSNDINPQLRSERIEIDVMNKDNSLSPGMYADVILESKGNPSAYIVPKTSVVNSTERKYVIITKKGLRKKIDVITRNESVDKIEVFGNLNQQDSVIIRATDEIKL